MPNESIYRLVKKHGLDPDDLPGNVRALVESLSGLIEDAEQDRKNSNELINNASDLMWSLDPQFRLVVANEIFIQQIKLMTGVDIKPGDLLLDTAFPAEVLELWEKWYLRALNGETFRVEFYNEPTDTWSEISFHPLLDNSGIKGASCYLRDITEKKRNTDQIRRSVEMMAEAERILQVGCWEFYFDEDEKVQSNTLRWSDEIFRIFGYQPGEFEVSYDNYTTLVYPNDQEAVKEALKQAFEKDVDYCMEYRIIRPDGSLRWIRAKGDIIRDKKTGKRIKMTGTGQDITERKSFEEERTRINSELVQRNKDLQQFAYIISHNLRVPVANILGLAKLLEDHKLKENEKQQCLQGLVTSTKRLDETIIDLNYILQVKDQASERKEMVNFETLVKNITEGIQHIIESEKVEIRTDFTEVPEMFTIKNYLHSVFFNLISNSIKYRKRDVSSLIEISGRKEGNKIIIVFKDNGLGMDINLYGDKVFGLYKRFHAGIEGKGMGLYMVKTQMEALGGTISVKSGVNKGTEMILEFENK